MLRDNEIAEVVKQKLKQTDFAHSQTAIIRSKIENYYEEHGKISITGLSSELPSDLCTYLENILFQDMFWKKEMNIAKEDIVSYIQLIKEANLKRRLKHLKDKIKDNENVNNKTVAERDAIIIQLMNN